MLIHRILLQYSLKKKRLPRPIRTWKHVVPPDFIPHRAEYAQKRNTLYPITVEPLRTTDDDRPPPHRSKATSSSPSQRLAPTAFSLQGEKALLLFFIAFQQGEYTTFFTDCQHQKPSSWIFFKKISIFFEKSIDKSTKLWYNLKVAWRCWHGSVGRARHW